MDLRAIFVATVLVVCISADYCNPNLPSSIQKVSASDKLLLVQTITRHGDRTPLLNLEFASQSEFMEPDPVWSCNTTTLGAAGNDADMGGHHRLFRTQFKGKEIIKGNCYTGQLTDRGYNQHFELGRALRRVYEDFGIFENGIKSVYVRSTNVPRTLMSALAQINGMFPQKELSENQVIDVETRDAGKETITPDGACPTYSPMKKILSNSEEYTNYFKSPRFLNFTDSLKKSFKTSGTYFPSISDMFDLYTARRCHKFPNPAPITDAVMSDITEFSNFRLNFFSTQPQLMKIGMGSFIKTLRDNLISASKGNSTIRYMLFSGHDYTIAPLLGALGLYDGVWPGYASYIQIELWARTNQFYVQFKYDGKPLYIPQCRSTWCTLKDTVQWFTKSVPTVLECTGKGSKFREMEFE